MAKRLRSTFTACSDTSEGEAPFKQFATTMKNAFSPPYQTATIRHRAGRHCR